MTIDRPAKPDFRPVVAGRPRTFCCHSATLSGRFPPNSLPAIVECVAAGAARLEVDVRFLADDTMAIFHDPDVSAATTGSGRIDALDWQRVQGLRYRMDESVPVARLEDVVDAMRDGATLLQVDLKLMRPISAVRREALVRALAPLGDRVLVGSQAHWNLRGLGDLAIALDPTLQWNYSPGRPVDLLPARLGVHGLWDDAAIAGIKHATAAEYFEARIRDLLGLLPQAVEWMVDIETLLYLASRDCLLGERLHQHGIELAAWTMRDEGEDASKGLLRTLFALGADTIITDDAAVLAGIASGLL